MPDRHLAAADEQAGDAGGQDEVLAPAEDRADRPGEPGRGLRGRVRHPAAGEEADRAVDGEVAGGGGVRRHGLEDE